VIKYWRQAAIAVPVVAAVLWGLGFPGHAQPGGPDAPAAVAARATYVQQQAERAAERAKIAQENVFLAAKPKGAPEFSATFSGSSVDTSTWTTCYPEMNLATGCTNFGNKEYQWYLPSQDRVSGGVLRLVAKREPTPGQTVQKTPKEYSCRSGVVTTYPSLQFEYGFVQVVAKIPHKPGLWSGLWLAAADNIWPPEIDMIESWGVDNETAAFFHPATKKLQQNKGNIPVSLTQGWQTYSVSWTKSEMEYFVGDTKVLTVTRHVPHQLMYFLADLAESVKPAAGNCSGQLEIRSVKVWPY
jgi:beta-glucanase (GH16 family)